MFDKGLIVSIQGYSKHTTEELIQNVINAGAVAIRTDKNVNCNIPVIGLKKIKIAIERTAEAYITPDIDSIKEVSEWADYVAIDYRRINKNLQKISGYVQENKIKVVADIESIKDYKNIISNKLHYNYIATTMSVFRSGFFPSISILSEILKINYDEKIIAEGNFKERDEVRFVFDMGIKNICIGSAISNVYKLTKKYVSVL